MTESLPKTGSSSAKPASAKSAAKAPVQASAQASAQASRRRGASKPTAATLAPVLAAPLAEPASGLDAVAAAVSEVVAETAKAVETAAAKSAETAEAAPAAEHRVEHRVERTVVAQVPPSRPVLSETSAPSETTASSAAIAPFGQAASAWVLPGLAAASPSRLSGFTSSFIPSSMVNLMSVSPFRNYEEVAAFGKANFEALVQANTVFAQGLQSLSQELLSVAQSSLEKNTAATKALLGARTVQDVVALQADYTKDALDTLVQNSTRFGEMSVKLATDASAPLTARINSTVEKAVRPAAAASKAAASTVSNVVDIATSNEAVA